MKYFMNTNTNEIMQDASLSWKLNLGKKNVIRTKANVIRYFLRNIKKFISENLSFLSFWFLTKWKYDRFYTFDSLF